MRAKKIIRVRLLAAPAAASLLCLQAAVQGQQGSPGWTAFANCATARAMTLAKGALWVATDAGLFRCDTVSRAITCFSNINSALPGPVRALAAAPDGTLYAGAAQGMARFDGTAWSRLTDWTGKAGIVSAACDSAGTLYVSTGFGGVYKYDGKKWRDLLDECPGFPIALALQPVYLYTAGSTLWAEGSSRWAWFENKPLAFFDGRTWTTAIDESNWACALDGKNSMWCLHGLEYGPLSLECISCAVTKRFSTPLQGGFRTYMMHISPDTRIWIWDASSYEKDISIWAGEGAPWQSIPKPADAGSSDALKALAFDASGKAWGAFGSVTHSAGLAVYSRYRDNNWKKEFGLPAPVLPETNYNYENQVVAFAEGLNDSVWTLQRQSYRSAVWDGHGWHWDSQLPVSAIDLAATSTGVIWLALSNGYLYGRKPSGRADSLLLVPWNAGTTSPQIKFSKGKNRALYAAALALDTSRSPYASARIFRCDSGSWSLYSRVLTINRYYNVSISFAAGDDSWLIVGDSVYTYSTGNGWRARNDFLFSRGFGKLSKALAAPDGTIWLGTTAGRLIKIKDADTLVIAAPATGGPLPYTVAPLTVDSAGAVWCSLTYYDASRYAWLYAGLGRYNGTWSMLDCGNSGIPSNQVNDVLFDSRGRMWVATDFGIGMYDPRAVSFAQPDRQNCPRPPDLTKRISIVRSLRGASHVVAIEGAGLTAVSVFDVSGRLVAKAGRDAARAGRFSLRLNVPGRRVLAVRATRRAMAGKIETIFSTVLIP